MELQTQNPREKNYAEVNEKVYNQLEKRQIAFKFKPEKERETLFVFTEPTIGQTEIIQGGSSNALKEFRKVFGEMVVIPDKEKFNKIYSNFYSEDLAEFGRIFATALEEKKKK